ncbi:PHD finger protein 14 [Eumeta japonica]|uniref:PHD finger protein 14 n=1 Tax=Eumeta variegata TaxID=151549 RepID=A0A4C1XXL1_EUMVA|nr:PHD finger protein 14 [Eumeta japonica]
MPRLPPFAQHFYAQSSAACDSDGRMSPCACLSLKFNDKYRILLVQHSTENAIHQKQEVEPAPRDPLAVTPHQTPGSGAERTRVSRGSRRAASGPRPPPAEVTPLVQCDVCNRPGDNSNLVGCDECFKRYHFTCLEPPLNKNPKKRGYSWHCADCDPTLWWIFSMYPWTKKVLKSCKLACLKFASSSEADETWRRTTERKFAGRDRMPSVVDHIAFAVVETDL